MRRLYYLTSFVVLALAVVDGCKQQERIKIALIMKARTNPFFQKMAEGALAAAKQNNVELLIPRAVADQILRAYQNGSFRFDVIVIDVDEDQGYTTTSKHTWSGYPVGLQASDTFGELVIEHQPRPTSAPARSRRQPAARGQR